MSCYNLGAWPTPKKDTQCLSQDEGNWMLWNGNGLWLGLKLHDKENKLRYCFKTQDYKKCWVLQLNISCERHAIYDL
jgi:hypothetical protein